VVEIGDLEELAGRVRPEREHEIGRRHAAAVVAHAHEPRPAFLEVDVDERRAGVERVLDQLLDDRRGPLDHLAGGDLVLDLLRQHRMRASGAPASSGAHRALRGRGAPARGEQRQVVLVDARAAARASLQVGELGLSISPCSRGPRAPTAARNARRAGSPAGTPISSAAASTLAPEATASAPA
jgi:hypothetical protein